MRPGWPARIVLFAAAVAGLCAAGAGQSPPGEILLRIPKTQAAVAPADALAAVTAVEELGTAWIARAPVEVVSRLRSAGVAFDELPAASASYAYYLVFDASGADLEELGHHGRLFAGDDTAWLLLAPADRPRAIIPRHLSFKQLIGTAAGPVVISQTRGALPGAPLPVSPSLAPSPAAARLAALVSEARLAGTIAALESFGTRFASTSNCEASGAFLLETFRDLGLAAESDAFTFGATRFTTSNIVATLPGRADPARVVIVSAHYDSYSDERETVAPGADDNASGVAAVVEAARLLASQPLDFTVRFIAFGAEEWGLLGAQHYVQAALGRGEQIVGVVNLDMIGYADRLPEDLDIVANAGSSWLAERMAASAPLPTVRHVRTSFGSDCSAFWQAGVASVCGIEDASLTNPYYHRATDRLDTLNRDLFTDITRATVATVTDLAQPVGAVPTPAGLVARSHVNSSLFLRARTVLLEWQAGTAGEAGYNVYRAMASHGSYQRLNGAPLRRTSYVDALIDPRRDVFYVVTAVDETGRESNYSGEAGVVGDLTLGAR